MKKLVVRLLFVICVFAFSSISYAQRGRTRQRAHTVQNRNNASSAADNSTKNAGWDFLVAKYPSFKYEKLEQYLPPSTPSLTQLTKEVDLPGLSIASYQVASKSYLVFFKKGRPVDSMKADWIESVSALAIQMGLKKYHW